MHISCTNSLCCKYQVQVFCTVHIRYKFLYCKFHVQVLCTVHVMYKFFSRYISCTSSLHCTVYISCTISLHFYMSCTFHVQVLCTENIMFSALFILCNVNFMYKFSVLYRVHIVYKFAVLHCILPVWLYSWVLPRYSPSDVFCTVRIVLQLYSTLYPLPVLSIS